MKKTYNAILIVDNLIKINLNELHKFREKYNTEKSVFELLPKYTITNNNKLMLANEYLYYAGIIEDDSFDEEFYLFDLTVTDEFLKHELSFCSYEEFFDRTNWKKAIEKLPSFNFETFDRHFFIQSSYLTVKFEYLYSHSYEFGINECDGVYGYIVGYLDNNLNKIDVDCELEKN